MTMTDWKNVLYLFRVFLLNVVLNVCNVVLTFHLSHAILCKKISFSIFCFMHNNFKNVRVVCTRLMMVGVKVFQILFYQEANMYSLFLFLLYRSVHVIQDNIHHIVLNDLVLLPINGYAMKNLI